LGGKSGGVNNTYLESIDFDFQEAQSLTQQIGVYLEAANWNPILMVKLLTTKFGKVLEIYIF
jgi:hypothetical protein